MITKKKQSSKLAERQINSFKKFPEMIAGLPKFHHAYAMVLGDANKRKNYFLQENTGNILEEIIDTITTAKYETNSKEYEWNNDPDGDIIIFLPGKSYIEGMAKFLNANADVLGDFLIVKVTSTSYEWQCA